MKKGAQTTVSVDRGGCPAKSAGRGGIGSQAPGLPGLPGGVKLNLRNYSGIFELISSCLIREPATNRATRKTYTRRVVRLGSAAERAASAAERLASAASREASSSSQSPITFKLVRPVSLERLHIAPMSSGKLTK